MKKRTTSQRRKQETISAQHIEETPLQKLVKTGMMEFVMQAGIESVLELIVRKKLPAFAVSDTGTSLDAPATVGALPKQQW